MSRRLSMIPFALLLGIGLVILPACKKKKPPEADPTPAPVPGAGPASGPATSGGTDYFVYAQLNAKGIRDGALFAEVKQGIVKAGGAAEWDKAENEMFGKLGFKPTDVDSVIAVVPDAPTKGAPNVVVITTTNKAIDKATLFRNEKVNAPDADGFYKVESDTWLHLPDEKTLVVVSPALAQRYLNGYAKNRSGWPLTSGLTSAASGHTALVVVNVQKAPRQAIDQAGPELAALASAQKVTVTVDLKEKELVLGVRGTYADAATAGKAKEQASNLLKAAPGFVNMFANSPEAAEFASAKPAIAEAKRAVEAAKLNVSGSDVVLTASYKADFDLGPVIAEVVKKMGETGGRMTAQNNLKQIGLGLHNYESVYRAVPIHAVGANGAPLKNAADKPLLSWRVALLPYLEQDTLYKQFKLNEPWDSPNNKKLIEQMPKIFAPVDKPGKPGYTHLQMVIGPGGMSPLGTSIASIRDGASNTIAVVEAAEPVIWTKPDDIVLPAKWAPGELKKKFGGLTPGGFNVAMWDGSVRFVRDTIDERTLALALNPNDGQPLPFNWNDPVPGKK